MPCQRKPDKFNCGLFAFANAITLASGGNPAAEQCQYDVSQMRGHLNRCFLDNKIIPIPLLKYLVSRPIIRGKPPDPSLFIPKTYDVFCNCRCSVERFSDSRNPDAINLVECQDDDCPHIWFHPKCMEISYLDFQLKLYSGIVWTVIRTTRRALSAANLILIQVALNHLIWCTFLRIHYVLFAFIHGRAE